MSFRIRRGVDADRQTRTFDLGEPVYITDTGKLYIGDGSTPGGVLLTTELSDDSAPELSGSLDLNGNNIVGTGNINIDGTITASGNINLGDGAEDNVIVGGQISSDLIPADDGIYDLGSETRTWKSGYFEGLTVDGEINANSIAVDSIVDRDSTVIWESSVNELQADLRGDVYAQDSGVIVDSERGDIFATDIRANIVFSNLQGTVFANNGNLIIDSLTSDVVANNLNANKVLVQPTTGPTEITASTQDEFGSVLSLEKQSETSLQGSDSAFGRILFNRFDDVNGGVGAASISASDVLIATGVADNGDFTDSSRFYSWTGEFFGIGKIDPSIELDVNGSAAISGEITAGGFIQFGSYTDSDRPTGVNGMVIYNTTTNRFQGYQNNAWINLDDGTSA